MERLFNNDFDDDAVNVNFDEIIDVFDMGNEKAVNQWHESTSSIMVMVDDERRKCFFDTMKKKWQLTWHFYPIFLSTCIPTIGMIMSTTKVYDTYYRTKIRTVQHFCIFFSSKKYIFYLSISSTTMVFIFFSKWWKKRKTNFSYLHIISKLEVAL